MLKIRPVLLLLALAACLGVVAGCGDDVEPSAADRSAQQAKEELEKQPAAEEAEPVQAEKVEPAAGEGDLSTKPKIAKPTGDPPKELNLPAGELPYASDLIALVRELGDFSVGVAVHPEGHPASTKRAEDRRRQAEKLALADFGLSQFFFEAPVWFAFLDDLRQLGVTTPVIPGIMPVLNVKSVKRMAEMSGAAFPRWLEDRLRAYEDDDEAMHAVGIEAATQLCRDLMDGGVTSFHFYTLNRSPATREIYTNLGLAPESDGETVDEH